MADYFYEDYHPGQGIRLDMDRVLFDGQTAFQKVLIFENAHVGRVLVLDGVVQTTEMDEHIYHEMASHVPIFAHGSVKRVLIIGGGDGGMLRHALMHGVDDVTMIDIDPEVVALCREHLAKLSRGAFDDARANYIAGEGNAYVRETDERFDVIIIDSTDPMEGPGAVLFTQAFYEACRNCMTVGGVLTLQSGVPFHEGERLRKLSRNLGAAFDDMSVYLAAVPTYYGGYMAFGWATDDANLRRQPVDILTARFEASGIETLFYTPEIHAASFAHPRFVQRLMAKE